MLSYRMVDFFAWYYSPNNCSTTISIIVKLECQVGCQYI